MKGLFIAGTVTLLLMGCGAADRVEHLTLDENSEPMRSLFQADSGKVRAVFLAAPTCGHCLRAIRDLRSQWLDQEPSTDIAVYVVWSPQAGGRERHLSSATGLLADSRALHFWDPDMIVGAHVSSVLGLPRPAWDVWVLFGPSVTWGDEGFPDPDWWEHQLAGLDAENYLDPQRFHQEAHRLLRSLPTVNRRRRTSVGTYQEGSRRAPGTCA